MSGGGGNGSDAGEVAVTAAGAVTTSGDHATGILAQSIGGGGGSSGSSIAVSAAFDGVSLALAVGGSGGEAGSADEVNVESSGDIQTSGDEADGIVAQSIGGGGGNAGYVFSASGLSDASISVSLGADGGAGGDGGEIDVFTYGGISTQGSNSIAILAQSIGGGGGKSSATGALDAMSDTSIAVAVGASGGEGGNAAKVFVKVESGEELST